MGLFGVKDGVLDWDRIKSVDLAMVEEADETDKLEDLYEMIIRANPKTAITGDVRIHNDIVMYIRLNLM